MARVFHTATDAPGTIDYDGAVPVFLAADTVNKERCKASGKPLIVAKNADSAVHTATVTSVADPHGRTRDAALGMASASYAVFGPFARSGWEQSTGEVFFEADSTQVSFFVVRTEP